MKRLIKVDEAKVDVVQSRLDIARELAADDTLLINKQDTDEQTADKLIQLLGERPDISMDACGYGSAQRVALLATRTAGVVLVVGIGEPTVEIPLSQALLREVDIRGSYRIMNTYPAAIAAVSSGAICLKKFITHHFPLEKAKEALDLAKTGAAMKVIIHVQE